MNSYNSDPRAPDRARHQEPDAHGQAALILTESLIHVLVEASILSPQQAVDVLRTAAEVKVEVAVAAGESRGRMMESLALLARIQATFEIDNRPG